MKYESWVGHSDDGPVVMWIKTLFTVKKWKTQLHKIVKADLPGCFHTHPARALRVVLGAGYIEEVWVATLMEVPCKSLDKVWRVPGGNGWTYYRTIRRGFIGWVTPNYTHRVASLLGTSSISLWIRGPVTHKICLRGWGWPQDKVTSKETS